MPDCPRWLSAVRCWHKVDGSLGLTRVRVLPGNVTKAKKDEGVGGTCGGMAGVLTRGIQAG